MHKTASCGKYVTMLTDVLYIYKKQPTVAVHMVGFYLCALLNEQGGFSLVYNCKEPVEYI